MSYSLIFTSIHYALTIFAITASSVNLVVALTTRLMPVPVPTLSLPVASSITNTVSVTDTVAKSPSMCLPSITNL